MEITDESLTKTSICPKCKGMVKSGLKEHFDANTTARNEFKKDVFDYDLTVVTQTVKEFKVKGYEFCVCKK